MSFIDDLINKGKEYVSEFTDNQIAEIKDYMGRYNTFEKKIIEIKNKILNGSYSNDIILKYQEILARQQKLNQQCDTFMQMTDTVSSDFSDYKFNLDYIKSKLDKINEVASIVYQFFTETKPLIDEQEQQINDIQQLMAGSSPTILNIKNFIKQHWLISTIGGYIVIKKILK